MSSIPVGQLLSARELESSTGSRGDYWTTLAVVPDILKMSAETVFALLQPGRVLDPQYRELAILRTAIVGDCKFEYSQHLKVARMVGLPEERVNVKAKTMEGLGPIGAGEAVAAMVAVCLVRP